MVVISAAILSKSGKTLVARQFVEINRPRIEGLLAAFPKLLGSGDSKEKKQHTFIETPAVRYVYQPMEDLYMLIITNKSSNILEDLDALHLLAKIVGDYCTRLDEEEVVEASFDLIFAFDECFALGYKEKLTTRQIEENLEMDSHNERIHEIMQKNREREAETQAQEVAARLERERRQGTGINSISSQLPSQANSSYASESRYESKPVASAAADEWGSKEKSSGSGMKLSVGTKMNKDDAFLQQVAKQDSTVSVKKKSAASSSSGSKKEEEKQAIDFELTETISATIDKEGEICSVAIKGELNVFITSADGQAIRAHLPPQDPNFSFKTHPAVDKAAFKNNILTPKDPVGQAFPLNRKVPVATWKSKGKDLEELAPITVNCWPSAGSESTTVVNMEFELQHKDKVLRNLVVKIPVPSKAAPVVQKAVGDYKYDARAKVLEWSVPLVDEDSSDGNLEFVVANLGKTSDLFPIDVSFVCDSTVCSINPLSVEPELPFSKRCNLTTENYQIVEEGD